MDGVRSMHEMSEISVAFQSESLNGSDMMQMGYNIKVDKRWVRVRSAFICNLFFVYIKTLLYNWIRGQLSRYSYRL
jgi:hypothetical protein